jgi:hypothetical protein
MSRGPCAFKQRDVTKAVKAVAAAGIQITRVEVEKNGKIVIITVAQPESGTVVERNEWDQP